MNVGGGEGGPVHGGRWHMNVGDMTEEGRAVAEGGARTRATTSRERRTEGGGNARTRVRGRRRQRHEG
jgi:hypothetical protein